MKRSGSGKCGPLSCIPILWRVAVVHMHEEAAEEVRPRMQGEHGFQMNHLLHSQQSLLDYRHGIREGRNWVEELDKPS